ncbi:hypothetical protein L1987_68680 [Smallanthus sonchifolius]|uniref:Uncharacterized protein n=1 Tax=Smallanthus sonchifolius TaxID=185202 RepID=A0ACB9B5I8_9ASTR|nr:hypothetical protein L1987_68680 [Smallanthus sonchifolius]
MVILASLPNTNLFSSLPSPPPPPPPAPPLTPIRPQPRIQNLPPPLQILQTLSDTVTLSPPTATVPSSLANPAYPTISQMPPLNSSTVTPTSPGPIRLPFGAAHGETPDIKDAAALSSQHQNSLFTLPFFQKLIAGFLGTYFMVFTGCGVVVVDTKRGHVIGQTGIAIVWGLVVMVMVYAVGHISGAHFNSAVPSYIIAQLLGSTLASGTLRLIYDLKNNDLGATVPSGSNLQSLVLEFIITFYLMFVISAVATDDRAVSTKFRVSCLPILS